MAEDTPEKKIAETRTATIELDDYKFELLNITLRDVDRAMESWDPIHAAREMGIDLSNVYQLLDFFRSHYQPFIHSYKSYSIADLYHNEVATPPANPDEGPVFYGGDVQGPATTEQPTPETIPTPQPDTRTTPTAQSAMGATIDHIIPEVNLRLANEPIVAHHRPIPRARWAPEEAQRLAVEVHPSAAVQLVDALRNNAEEAVINDLVGRAVRESVERFADEQNIPRNAQEREERAATMRLIEELRPIAHNDDAIQARLAGLSDHQRNRLEAFLDAEANR